MLPPAPDDPQHPPAASNNVKCTPTKCARLMVYHGDMKLPFTQIAQHSPFKNIDPQTLSNNHNLVKSHGGDCYYNGKKGKTGRKRTFMEAQLNEAEERLESGELIDVEDVRRVMFPKIPAHTIRDNLSQIGLESFAQQKKPNLLPRHQLIHSYLLAIYRATSHGRCEQYMGSCPHSHMIT
ncbi:hypothetical protein GGX14DRAFT_384587 [Mycena pura]|uniref:Uncharacterized protein n=1 Tax=Mycena pura TaxID=153505 RepID=A0AAD7E6R2_9AGAR|nr:hypothetical protein GGX14DRAFT_384587 [Mycena pura]